MVNHHPSPKCFLGTNRDMEEIIAAIKKVEQTSHKEQTPRTSIA